MNLKTITILVAIGLFFASLIIYFGTKWHYENEEVALREQAEAQRGKVEAVYDEMWKIISEQANIADKYQESFRQIYTEIISGRYSQGDGTLMKWIQERNPTLDASLYKKVMNSIEIQRENFTNQQTRMLDIIREHKTLVLTKPGSFFLSDIKEIEFTVISSTRAKKVMETGIDDELLIK